MADDGHWDRSAIFLEPPSIWDLSGGGAGVGYAPCYARVMLLVPGLGARGPLIAEGPGSRHDTGYLGLVHWDDPEGGYGAAWSDQAAAGGPRRAPACWWGSGQLTAAMASSSAASGQPIPDISCGKSPSWGSKGSLSPDPPLPTLREAVAWKMDVCFSVMHIGRRK